MLQSWYLTEGQSIPSALVGYSLRFPYAYWCYNDKTESISSMLKKAVVITSQKTLSPIHTIIEDTIRHDIAQMTSTKKAYILCLPELSFYFPEVLFCFQESPFCFPEVPICSLNCSFVFQKCPFVFLKCLFVFQICPLVFQKCLLFIYCARLFPRMIFFKLILPSCPAQTCSAR